MWHSKILTNRFRFICIFVNVNKLAKRLVNEIYIFASIFKSRKVFQLSKPYTTERVNLTLFGKRTYNYKYMI